jgi:peptidoglycan/xylan/chitin deacetylase (PgdA/CDA1 family)
MRTRPNDRSPERSQAAGAVPILMYHSISTESTPRFRPLVVSPAAFEWQMAFLAENGFRVLTVSQFVAASRTPVATDPRRTAVLSFDDGYADFYTHALPVLHRYRFPATLYLVTGCLDGTSRWLKKEGEDHRPMLTWRQVQEIHATGLVECGAHSHSHPCLDTLARPAAEEEVRRSKDLLETRLGSAVETFAYPYGCYDEWTRLAVSRAGFTSACAVKIAMSAAWDDPLALARVQVSGDTGPSAFADLLDGVGLAIAPPRERFRRRVRRAYQRTIASLRRRVAGRE